MPLYEYECEQCGEHFELMQKFADPPLTRHEKCGGSVHRLISAPALQFKGSGWYVTDYAKGGSSSGNGAPAKSDSSGTTKSGSESGGTNKTASDSSHSTPAHNSSSSSDTKSGSSSGDKGDK